MKKKFIYLVFFTIMLIFCWIIVSSAQGKQELKVAFSTNVVTLDPHYYIGSQDLIATDLLYDTLVTYDRDRNIAPRLATSWKQIDDLTWEIELREGVTFHSGNPFNAEAVKFSVERCSKTSPGSGYAGMVDHVDIVSNYIVRVVLKYEYGPIMNNFTSPVVGIMDPAFVKEKGEDIGQFASGTGPYKLEEYITGNKIVFVKNENYWGEPAKIAKVEYIFIPEASTRVMALKSGEVDLVESPPTHEIPNIEKDKNLYSYISPKSRTLFIGFNMKHPNVGGEENLALREAINYAIDREEIAIYLLDGLATAAPEGIMPASVTGGLSDPTFVRKHDLEKAKQILEDAGIQSGKTIEFLVSKGRYLMDAEIAEVIQRQVSKIGINLELTHMEYASLWSTLKGDGHQMYQIAYGVSTGDPGQPYIMLLSSKGGSNFAKWGDEETDKILNNALRTGDREKRLFGYEQLYRRVFEDAVLIPIVLYQNIYGANNQLKNLFVSPEEMIDIKNCYFEE